MTKHIDVMAIGTRVKIGDGEVPGLITAISIRQDSKVSYEIVWWDGRSRRAEWLGDMEIQAIDEMPKTRVGFNT